MILRFLKELLTRPDGSLSTGKAGAAGAMAATLLKLAAAFGLAVPHDVADLLDDAIAFFLALAAWGIRRAQVTNGNGGTT